MGRQLGVWSALGVVAAAVLAVCVNIIAARHYERWDVTSAALYTLSPPSLETLAGLSESVQVLVFLSQADPEYGSVQRLLDQYTAESRLIQVRYVDPDRQPAEFTALQNRYRLMQGRAEQGRLVSDAAIVVAAGDARWVITPDEIVSYDEERGTVQPRLEQAVTEGLRQVLHPNPTQVCFTTGQQEASIDDGGPTGLGGLRYMLEKNNYGVREVDLTSAGSDLALSTCDLVIVAAPGVVFSPAAAGRLVAAARRGTSLVLSVGPTFDEDNHTSASGLEPLLELFGIRAGHQLIFEREPELALPLGIGGEAFMATPKPHAVTRGMLTQGEARFRVVMQLAQGFHTEGKAAPLLTTSARAFAVSDAAILATPGASLDSVRRTAEGPFTVALAAELESGPAEERPARLVAFGSSGPLLGNTWQDPSLAGTRRFVESALSWAAARPTLVNLADKPERQADLRFTEQAMSEVARYVLLYMPATALAIGALVLIRRRSTRGAGAGREAAS